MHATRPGAMTAFLLGVGAMLTGCGNHDTVSVSAPVHLADTGLFADFASRTVAEGVLGFTPQYPLWTDGAEKERWIALPAGTSIDARDVDHWDFPIGTRLWKQFSFGRPIETRYMQRRADGSWLYATYQWTADGRDAVLAPEGGVARACPTVDGHSHDLPSISDCRACHEGTRTPVLGFNALQLSSDRDPLAPHATPPRSGDVDLPALVARGLVRNLPEVWSRTAPRIAAATPRERAVLGYLFGNCSSCHCGDGPLVRLGMRFDLPLAQAAPAPAIATTVGIASSFTRPGASLRIVPGAPAESVLVRRLAATDPLTQMPPFGRHLADQLALNLVEEWIAHDLASTDVSINRQPITQSIPTKRD